MKSVYAFILFASMQCGAFAQTFTSLSSGDWTNTATWDAAAVPESSNHVHIAAGTTVTINGTTAYCNDISIDNGGALNLSNNPSLRVYGNWSNGGSFAPGCGEVKFMGSAAQSIGGNGISQFFNLEINNSAGVALSSEQKIKGLLTLTQGTLSTAGYNFTFLSDLNSTASIGAIQAGADINGNIIMQRYLSSAVTGWRLLGSPVNGATLQDWSDDFVTTGFPGSTYPFYNFCSVYSYDESVGGTADYGYTSPVSANQALTPGSGYWAWIGPTPMTMEVTGTPEKFNHTFAVTYNSSAGKPEDGWNLIANPYPSAIDWHGTGWTKTFIDDAIYIWDPSQEQYSSYVNGVGVNGGSNIIPSSQAFWVQANQNNPVLSCTENIKTSSDAPCMRAAASNKTIVRLALKGGSNLNDETAVCFSSSASANFDSGEDALKLFSATPQVNSISSVSYTTDLAINSLPLTAYTVPLRVKVGISGAYSITRDTGFSLASGTCLYLHDLLTNTQFNLGANPVYTFTINDTTAAPRFVLHMGQPLLKSELATTCSYKKDGKAIISGNGTGPWNVVWKDALGNTLATHNNVTAADTLFNLGAGTYSAQVSGNPGLCAVLGDLITVKAAEAIVTNANVTDVLCKNESTGMVDAGLVSGGKLPLNYKWSNGDTAAIAKNLGAGHYKLILSDANACSDTSYHIVKQISSLAVDFSTAADTFNLSNSIVAFFNSTSGHDYVIWNFGDGSVNNYNYNCKHTFLNAGTYTVELSAGDNNTCVETIKKPIVVLNSIDIKPQYLNENVSIYNSDGETLVKFNLQHSSHAVISVYSIDGKLISSKQLMAAQNTESIALGEASGIYLVNVNVEGSAIVKKVVK